MRVAYDVSVLGRGYLDPRSRTGVFRATESLFLALNSHSDIRLKALALNGSGDRWDDTLAAQYFKDACPTRTYRYVHTYTSRLGLADFYAAVSSLQRRYINFSQQHAFWLYRLSYGVKLALSPALKRDLVLLFEPQDYQIYHSPFFALPSREVTGNLPRILTVYDLIPVLYPQFMSLRIHQTFLKTLSSIDLNRDWVLCDSHNTRNDLCSHTQISPDRVFVTPLAANEHFFPVDDRAVIEQVLRSHRIPLQPYLLSLCTLEPRKNLACLIRCFFKLLHDHPTLDLNLVLVGVVGWKTQAFFEQLGDINPILRTRLIMTGYVADAHLSAIYSGATAFVYPSFYEGFGLPPLEAMQCGTPVITSNTSSLPEVVGEAGIMVDPNDEDALCQSIIHVVNDTSLRTKLAQAGLAQAKTFSWHRCAEETLKAYQVAADST